MPYVRRFTSEVLLDAFRQNGKGEMSASEVAAAIGAKSARAVAPTLHRMAATGQLQAVSEGNRRQRYRLPDTNGQLPAWLLTPLHPVEPKGARLVSLLDKPRSGT